MTYDNLYIVTQVGWKLFTIWWPVLPTVLLFVLWEKRRESRSS